MNVLRGLGTAILSLLLFLSLTVFGMAFLFHSTVLNPDFVADQVDKMDIPGLAREITEEQIAGELPEEAEFLIDPLLDIVDEQEPWLKAQARHAISTGYDFLLGKTDTLEITIELESLKASLNRDRLWEDLNERISSWLPIIVRDELRPYLEENLHVYARQIPKEYLPPEIAGLPDEQLLRYLDDYLEDIDEQITTQGTVPELSGLLEALVKPFFDQYYDEFIGEMPSEYVIDEEAIPAEVMEQLLLAREYIGYFQTGYYLLIVFMVVLAAVIFLVNWNVSKAALALGIDLTLYGVLELAGVIFARTFNFMQFVPDIPASMETWLNGLLKDILAPLQLFSIIILVIGIALIVASFFIRRGAAEGED
jgi:hypothetical protein